MNVCVFCSSSDAVGALYREAAAELGSLIARGGHSLVYGGGRFGLMGAVARAVRQGGSKVTGVIPRFIAERTESEVDRLIVTEDMRSRKAAMESLSDAFVALPGGFGTLEEILEIITLNQLGVLAKPVSFVNTAGFYDPLAAVFERLYADKFSKSVFRASYRIAADPAGALAYVTGWSPGERVDKWF